MVAYLYYILDRELSEFLAKIKLVFLSIGISLCSRNYFRMDGNSDEESFFTVKKKKKKKPVMTTFMFFVRLLVQTILWICQISLTFLWIYSFL